ncbi:MAG TPA: lamin tail domain-containing protein [Candidatus Peribacterales bacterium]|nr:lamin tail domain-containing protein [Candidatus Peribacterales bacterium]
MPRLRLIMVMAACLLCMPFARAAAKIVLSEIFWSGSDLSTADEWIELVNTGSGTASLSGWMLTRMSSGEETPMLMIPAGSLIEPFGFYLIGNNNESSSRLAIEPDFVESAVSLANTQLFLWLYDDNGTLIDTIDDGIGTPFAGSNALPKASMERIDLVGSGQIKTNWQTASTFINIDDGASMRGTPHATNGSGPSVDTFPPSEATNFAAETLQESSSGTLAITWTPSTSLDLFSQTLLWNGTGVTLSHSASGIALTGISTGVTFTLQSIDHSGNSSTGITTVSQPFPNVQITEVLANPAGADDAEWIEIANHGSEQVEIGGWILDEGNSPGNYSFPHPLLLQPNEHRAFPKTITTLPLGNDGETLTLKRGNTIVDTWVYEATEEEVSFGRSKEDPPLFLPFCVPTMNKPNDMISPNPIITIQSGNVIGEREVSLNLIAEVETGSTVHATCRWQYGDGFTSESCNPPSHTFGAAGSYEILLHYSDFCGNEMVRSLTVTVTEPNSSGNTAQSRSGQTGGTAGISGGKESGNRTSCSPAEFDGIRISEIFPNPTGDDADGEWIEIENTLSTNASLCGWTLDDGEDGSKPFVLDTYTLSPQSLLVLERKQTKLALNNSDESVRLFDPNGEVEDIVIYATSEEGKSFALREDDLFVWTPFVTPGSTNEFRTAERKGATQSIVISAVLPNPDGNDEGNEWIELTNVGMVPIDLFGWSLANAKGNAYVMPKMKMQPHEVRRLTSDRTSITLTNTIDEARLYDSLANLISLLGWSNAISGRTYFPSRVGERIGAEVVSVVDGDTIDVDIGGIRERVRMIGIDTPETVHPKKSIEKFGREASEFTKKILLGKNIFLEFDEEERDKYNRMLAYVLLMDGTNVNGELIRRGFAYAYLRFPFAYSALFRAYEDEARKAKIGLWADEEATDEIIETKKGIEEEATKAQGIVTGSGMTTSGSTLSGSMLIADDKPVAAPYTAPLQENPFSEIMSNPPMDGLLHDLGEYLELANPTDEPHSLAGWILDDDPQGSSKRKTLDARYVIEPQGYLLLCKSDECDLPLGISLNNDGEELSLASPDGNQIFSVAYPKIQRGESYAIHKNEWCVSSLITPRAPNICQQSTMISDSVQQKKISDATNTVIANQTYRHSTLRKKYRNIVMKDAQSDRAIQLHPLLAPLVKKEERLSIKQSISPSRMEILRLSATGIAMSFFVLGTALTRKKTISPTPQNASIPV